MPCVGLLRPHHLVDIAALTKLHHQEEAGLGLERPLQPDDERIVDPLQQLALLLDVLDLPPRHYPALRHHLHRGTKETVNIV